MAQPMQSTPTLQANIAGTSTTVNLRDWLNTRLGPFLKKAIIESFDSEAEFPLQWLGEHLIQQSIQFEGNPDSTNIQERFRYKHEAKPPRTLVQDNAPSQAAPTQPAAPSPQAEQNVDQTVVVPEVQPVQNQVPETANPATEASMMDEVTEPAAQPVQEAVPVAVPVATSTPATNVNGTAENPSDQVQDTEMSNAP